MNISKSKKIILTHAIIWASIMLMLAYLLKGNEQVNTIIIFMIGGWYISHAAILNAFKVNNSDNANESNVKTCYW
ncbi:hypothetical protein AAD001_07715 [Colwelliaceae bacterium 6471]